MAARGSNARGMGPVWKRRALWGLVVVLLAACSVAAFLQAGRVKGQLTEEATASGQALVEAALVPELTVADALHPATDVRYAEIAGAVDRQILADGTISSVTIWSPDGTILFAEDTQLVGQQVRSMRVPILDVLQGQARSELVRDSLRTLVPVQLGEGASVAVEFDRAGAPVRSAADPWRLMGLIAAAGAVLAALLLARSFSRLGRRAEGFDEEAMRAAVAQRARSERDLQAAQEKRRKLEEELEQARSAVRTAQAEVRQAGTEAAEAPRLRERLDAASEELRRSEEARAALEAHAERLQAAVDAESAKGREEVAAALAEVARLEATRSTLQDRAAKAEDALARLTQEVESLRGRPAAEAELEQARTEATSARRATEEQRERAERSERRALELEATVRELTMQVREHERRPDLSAKLEAATQALEIGREQIRALTAQVDTTDRARASLAAESEQARAELETARAELETLRGELAGAMHELSSTRSHSDSLEDETVSLRRQADAAGAVIAGAKSELMRAAEQMRALTARAEAAEAALEQERARRSPEEIQSADSHGAAEPDGRERGAEGLTVSVHPDGPAVELQPGAPPEVNGTPTRPRPRPPERIEVDTLVRRVVQDSWSDRGRMVSVYAEPVIVEGDAAGVMAIVDALLDRSHARTEEGTRLALQVEWVDHGALLSVEDGLPGTEEEMSPAARALAEERGGWARVGRLPNGHAIFRVWLPQSAPAPATSARPT
jgi:hypothetical protein